MGKTALCTNKNLINSQNKNRYDSSIVKTSSGSSRRARISQGNSTRRVPIVITNDKENVNSQGKSSSDISEDEEMESETIPQQVPRKKSAVHELATKLSPQEYQCKICSKIVRCTIDSNSNIRRHLALSHGKIEMACKSHLQPRIQFSAEKKRVLDEAAIACIITDSRCWGDFRRPGMTKFLSVAVRGYTGPSSRTVQRRLSKLYFDKSQQFKKELAEVKNLSITVDLWKSKRYHHYLCMTIHWLNRSFNLVSKILSFRQFKGRHLSLRIRRHMKRVLASYNLSNKITASITDNGANIKAASSQIQLFGARFHCASHALNLTVHKGLRLWPKKRSTTDQAENSSVKDTESANSIDDDVSDDDMAIDPSDETNQSDQSSSEEDEDEQFDQDDDSSGSSCTDSDNDDENDPLSPVDINEITVLMGKCRTIVVTIRKSSILSEFVHTLAVDQSINCALIIDMKVRWNSSYKMLQRLLLYQVVLDKLYEQLGSIPGVTDQQRQKLVNSKINGNDWNLIHALRRVLERFYDATKVLSGQNYPTLSLFYAIMISLSHYLNTGNDDPIENKIKHLLLNSFDKYMVRDGKEMAFIRVSALLDPVTHDILKLEDKRAAEVFIVKEIKEQRHSRNTSVSVMDSNTTTSNNLTTVAISNSKSLSSRKTKGASVINNFLEKCGLGVGVTQSSLKRALTIEQELAKLSSIPKDDYQFDCFWQEHEKILPKLTRIARKYLSIPSSSVPSESAFSTSNYILRKNRLALSSKNVKFTMFLKDKI